MTILYGVVGGGHGARDAIAGEAEILAAHRRPGEHLLVYTTGEGNAALAAALAQTGIGCRIYGMRRNLTAEVVEGNLRYQPFGEATFIDDLASCRAVIAGGGFTLMGSFASVARTRYLGHQRETSRWDGQVREDDLERLVHAYCRIERFQVKPDG